MARNASPLLEGLVLKRSIDFILAGLLLVLTLPLVFIAAVFIRLEAGDAVFFGQRRMGRGFRTFKLWKLRTMRSNGVGPLFTLGADPRITRVGWWLRRLKIDELPQLWNVLRGDMSLVGSRPVVPELAEEFEANYVQLLVARPGLTDPATVKYCREVELMALVPDPLDYFKNVIMPDKLRISLAYLERATVRSDVAVLMRTAVALMTSAVPVLTGQPGMEPIVVARSQKLVTAAEADSIR
jgi:lipopolysaccharide/colanic/teichoic acid biosynthesis glycosyltransferase